MGGNSRPGGYTLVICEKPDAAKRVSEALSEGKTSASQVEGVTVYRLRRDLEEYVVCAAQGHLYAISDPFNERAVCPIFDGEWYPLDRVEKGSSRAGRRIAAIRLLAEGASRLVNACDFDVEGETIGFNLLRYACGGESGALRARFSALTDEDLVQAFGAVKPQETGGFAWAGRTRHLVDFVWGVNLSRFLSQSALVAGHRYRTISAGRVQGPTLKFLVDRERAIRNFVPTRYWRVVGVFECKGVRFTALYSKPKLGVGEAQRIKDECQGKDGVVGPVEHREVTLPPYPPFNLGDLQKEAFRVFGYSPSRTLQIAEKLYLRALISYPRTGSQRLPSTIDCGKILRGLLGQAAYAKEVQNLLAGELKPIQGTGTDPAHPAIHPTGERPQRILDSSEAKLYDMIVRRFLSLFGPSARRETCQVAISVGNHEFGIRGSRTIFAGWISYYRRYWSPRDVEFPSLEEGDKARVHEIRIEEKAEEPPPRFSQGSLLEKMEKERIGTKATRAETISTLVARGYAEGEDLRVTELGLAVMEILERYVPSITTTDLTRQIEERLEAIEAGQTDEKELVRETVRAVSEQLMSLGEVEDSIGNDINGAVMKAAASAYALGNCPVCKIGMLRIVKSRKTGKRFVGCSNYPGCRTSAPLPQRGKLKASTRPCQHCSWPVVYIQSRGHPWKLCVNPGCPSKGLK